MTFGNARTKAELEEQLKTLDPNWWSTNIPPQGAINAYKCNTCLKCVLTVDMDRGVTPMFMGCKATEGCNGTSNSAGYPKTSPPLESLDRPKYEWYRPEANALGLFHEDQQVDEYIRRGGLLLRKKEA
jgi:hypothetical protein